MLCRRAGGDDLQCVFGNPRWQLSGRDHAGSHQHALRIYYAQQQDAAITRAPQCRCLVLRRRAKDAARRFFCLRAGLERIHILSCNCVRAVATFDEHAPPPIVCLQPAHEVELKVMPGVRRRLHESTSQTERFDAGFAQLACHQYLAAFGCYGTRIGHRIRILLGRPARTTCSSTITPPKGSILLRYCCWSAAADIRAPPHQESDRE